MDLLKTTKSALWRNGLVNSGATLLAAVSGGADSMALLHALHTLKNECGLELIVAHFDHRIRAQSGSDALFVREASERLGLRCVVGRGDVPALAQASGVSLETAARGARYGFLRSAALENGGAFIALAHHRGDQTETLLMHILRGSALNGLCAMRELGDGLFRPLLRVSRDEIEAYCACYNIEYRLDETNEQTQYTRNRVRLELLPLLRSFNPAFEQAAQKLIENAQNDCDALNTLASQAYGKASRAIPNGVALDSAQLSALPKALSSRVVLLAVEAVLGAKTDFETGHIEDVLALALKRAGASVDLPRSLIAAQGYGALLIIRQISYIFTLLLQNSTETPLGLFKIEKAGPFSAALDKTKLATSHVRTRRPGDWMRPKGLNGRKKVQDILVDAKIPKAYRDALPLIAFGDEVLWIPGVRESEAPNDSVTVSFWPKDDWPLHPRWKLKP